MTTNDLQRLDHPPAPEWFDAAAKATWHHLAPQVCRWSGVTALDLLALEVLITEARALEDIDARLQTATPAEAAVLADLRNGFALELGEPELWILP